jgi:alpha-mannosidase
MPAWGLLWDFTTLRELIDTLPANSTLQNKALTVANAIMNIFYKNDPKSIPAARKLADAVFGENWEDHGVDIYKYRSEEAQVWGIGHCHIDTAWYLPRVSNTLRVPDERTGCGRTMLHSRRLHGHGRHRST